jgi:hypothetical protein
VTRDFAESIAFMLWAELYDSAASFVGSALPDGRMVSFSDDAVRIVNDAASPTAIEAVVLDHLQNDEASALKLSEWLRDLLGGDAGIDRFDSGWSAWVRRSDGRVLEVGAFGYQLYEDMDGYRDGGLCRTALRGRAR